MVDDVDDDDRNDLVSRRNVAWLTRHLKVVRPAETRRGAALENTPSPQDYSCAQTTTYALLTRHSIERRRPHDVPQDTVCRRSISSSNIGRPTGTYTIAIAAVNRIFSNGLRPVVAAATTGRGVGTICSSSSRTSRAFLGRRITFPAISVSGGSAAKLELWLRRLAGFRCPADHCTAAACTWSFFARTETQDQS